MEPIEPSAAPPPLIVVVVESTRTPGAAPAGRAEPHPWSLLLPPQTSLVARLLKLHVGQRH